MNSWHLTQYQKKQLFKEKNNSQTFLTFIKNHFFKFGSVPLIIGGVVQFLTLKEIGYPFTRFFSVSQLLSDGLLLLFIGMVVLVILAIVVAAPIYLITNSKKKQIIILSYFLLIPIFVSTVVDGWFDIIELNLTLNSLSSLIFFILLVIITFFAIKGFPANFRRFSSSVMVLFWIVICYNVVIYGTDLFEKSFSSNNINTDVIECTLRNDYTDYEKHNVPYFNDKYLFINLTLNGEERTVVYPQETFFNFDCLNN